MTKRFLGCFSLVLALSAVACSDDKGFIPGDGEDGGGGVLVSDGGGSRDGGARADGGSAADGGSSADGGGAASDGGSVDARTLTFNGSSPVTVTQ